jgi:tetraacyldisaccharide 4'-kinase
MLVITLCSLRMNTLLERIWYANHPLKYCLLPLAALFRCLAYLRRKCLCRRQKPTPLPVIVVGNLSVGGTGKTPLVIYLVDLLLKNGYRPGVVSRGYGGSITQPHHVTASCPVTGVGDEALLLAKRCRCPVVIARQRLAALFLLQKMDCDIVISDDGLQHYQMARVLEIAVVDGLRRFGNGYCLPAGPLREPTTRLATVDFVVVNGVPQPGEYAMTFHPSGVRQLTTGERVEHLAAPLYAVAGIGNPDKFFQTLKALDLSFTPQPFPDHHPFRRDDFAALPGAIVMTEKDAVKCVVFAEPRFYYVPIDAQLSVEFDTAVLGRLAEVLFGDV